MSLAELVETTGIPRATAHRLAMALFTHRLLGRDEDGRFVPGGRLTELAAGVPDPLLLAAAPVLAWLRDATGESAQLYRVDRDARLCIAVAERATGLRTTVPIGSRLPLTAGSAAQVLCAWRTDPELPELLAQAQFSTRTLAEVRRRGWAQSVAEREAGVASVSAPSALGRRRRHRRVVDLGSDRAARPLARSAGRAAIAAGRGPGRRGAGSARLVGLDHRDRNPAAIRDLVTVRAGPLADVRGCRAARRCPTTAGPWRSDRPTGLDVWLQRTIQRSNVFLAEINFYRVPVPRQCDRPFGRAAIEIIDQLGHRLSSHVAP